MTTSTLGRTGFKVSRLGLGTTEIGFEYGIGERPIPSEKESAELLKEAVKLGITFIDTARYYGLAEERIFHSGILQDKNIIVATKCGHLLDRMESKDPVEMERLLREEIRMSLEKLNLSQLPLLQFHGGEKEQIIDGTLPNLAKKFKSEGLAKYIGISTRGEEAPKAAIESGAFDTIQIAYSILDQRMAKEVLPLAQVKGVGVINRSVFLKGVLANTKEIIPKELTLLEQGRTRAQAIAEKIKIDLPTLALRFALSNDLIHTSLIGTNKINHLKTAIAAIEMGPLPKDILEELGDLGMRDPKQVDPKHWPTSFHK